MSKFVVEALPVTKIFLGEGPHWDAKTQKLYYVDIFAKAVHSYDPATKQETKVVIQEKGEGEDSVTLVVPVENSPNKFVISVGLSLRLLEWDGKSASGKTQKFKNHIVVKEHNPNGRFNDGKCDSAGRLWAGTMGLYPGSFTSDEAKKGRLYALEKDGKLNSHLESIDISNGLAWSADNKTFYYIDSLTYLVEAFDFDLVKGSISKRRQVFDLKAHGLVGIPDGMCIDANGNLWVAVFGGGKILHIEPKTGKLIDTVELPATNITSVTFGGPNLDILYATSAQKGLSMEELAAQPLAGALFQITNTGTKGLSAGVNYNGSV